MNKHMTAADYRAMQKPATEPKAKRKRPLVDEVASRPIMGGDPNIVVAYQETDGGSWQICWQWGELCSPMVEKSNKASRVTASPYEKSPQAAVLAMSHRYPTVDAAFYEWPWGGVPRPMEMR